MQRSASLSRLRDPTRHLCVAFLCAAAALRNSFQGYMGIVLAAARTVRADWCIFAPGIPYWLFFGHLDTKSAIRREAASKLRIRRGIPDWEYLASSCPGFRAGEIHHFNISFFNHQCTKIFLKRKKNNLKLLNFK